MSTNIKAIWRIVRRLSGDDAYEQYLELYARQHHADTGHEYHPPLSKAHFFRQWQNDKWNGIKRCC